MAAKSAQNDDQMEKFTAEEISKITKQVYRNPETFFSLENFGNFSRKNPNFCA